MTKIKKDKKPLLEATKRFVKCVDYLIAEGDVKNNKDFTDKIGYTPQTMTQLRAAEQGVTFEMLLNVLEMFPHVNHDYIIDGSGSPLLLGDMGTSGYGIDMQKIIRKQGDYIDILQEKIEMVISEKKALELDAIMLLERLKQKGITLKSLNVMDEELNSIRKKGENK